MISSRRYRRILRDGIERGDAYVVVYHDDTANRRVQGSPRPFLGTDGDQGLKEERGRGATRSPFARLLPASPHGRDRCNHDERQNRHDDRRVIEAG